MEKKAGKMEISPPQRPPPSAPFYSLPPSVFLLEDILLCVDVDPELRAEPPKVSPSPASPARSRPLTRFHAIETAVRHFVHAKLSINPDHRFALGTIAKSFSWVKREFTNEAAGVVMALRTILPAAAPFKSADLTGLFKAASVEAARSRMEGRLLRVVLIYNRSNSPPIHHWPANEKVFTMDVVYLHEKPSPDNCPQAVFDALGDSLEHVSEYEGYILESHQTFPRYVCRIMYTLLCHPQQRCSQDDIDVPKAIAKRLPHTMEGISNDDNQSSASYN